MRLDRAHQFILDSLTKAPGTASAALWGRGPHTCGIHVTLDTGTQVWIGVTVAAAPGDKGGGPEIPVTDVPPAAVPYPVLNPSGHSLQEYLAAAVTNAGNAEVAHAYRYPQQAKHPGFGIVFHSGAKVFCLIHRTREQP